MPISRNKLLNFFLFRSHFIRVLEKRIEVARYKLAHEFLSLKQCTALRDSIQHNEAWLKRVKK